MTTIAELINTIFDPLTAEDQTTMAKQLVKVASTYLDKENHVLMAKYFIDSIADFPGE